ncbi:MAG: ABC transporter permease, partial [Propionibacteriales bacterium]|nr:ABC transporter permease [Propionibacteriales bacterium]
LVTAALRATAQLAVASLAIAAVLGSVWWSLAFALLMFRVATGTSARRTGTMRNAPWVAMALGIGVTPVLGLLLLSGVIPWHGANLVPTAGIVIGGTMTACTLATRRAFDELQKQFGAFEAALALGLPSRDAVLEIVAPTSSEALLPVLDQTRTVGLVTLPGAYVGVLLGGGSALEAGAAQLMVLIGLLAAETIAVVVLVRLVALARVLPPGLRARLPT